MRKMKARDFFEFRTKPDWLENNAVLLAAQLRREAAEIEVELDETEESLVAVIREHFLKMIEERHRRGRT